MTQHPTFGYEPQRLSMPDVPQDTLEALAHAHRMPTAYDPIAAGAVELSSERRPAVFVPSPDNAYVLVPRDSLPAGYLHSPFMTQPEPRPTGGIDKMAQRFAAAGVFAAGMGYGVSQVVNAVAGISGGVILGIAALVIAARMPVSRALRGGGDTYITTHNHQHTHEPKWFGKSSSATTYH
ncbi:hypothetical protein OIE69_43905 (plasmid) [Actinacidiphila glaucinigra]|uniref:hypothetical protein n=1 Tax=Actinacidiphila glaucinigra TaxID=235986 RepID=UPI002DDB5238|nr:hypothetical protein [Actinacidiphila glaucinigra]WSD65850.1 hypothetical protein OIE69_43905 [Actinacidiphila glaucinigra]